MPKVRNSHWISNRWLHYRDRDEFGALAPDEEKRLCKTAKIR